MAESDVIESTREPVTRLRLVRDLQALGVSPGDRLLVHSSLSAIGWVVGGARTVIDALVEAVGQRGTLVMPAFSADLSDPVDWQNPPVPAAWVEPIREAMPAFDPDRTPTRDMGWIAEAFRTWPGAKRSHHPICSVAALGPDAEAITRHQPLAFPLGDASPLGALYERDARVLLIGVGHDRNSSLHLAETRAPHGRRITRGLPVERDGRVVWEGHPDVVDDNGRLFPQLGAAFEASGEVAFGKIGLAEARLMGQRSLVDFAVDWFEAALDPSLS